MQVKIKDTELKMFGQDAKSCLSEHAQSYIEHIKGEAEKVAVGRFGIKDARVTKDIIEGVIKLQGHHVGKKPSVFFSYVLPLLETLFGGVLCNAVFVEDKTFWTGILIASCILLILGGVYLSFKHERS